MESCTSTYVCSCDGDVPVLDASGSVAKELAASHRKAVRISDAGSGPQMTEAPRRYHTDADLEKLAGDIGVTIDWNVIDK